MTSGEFLGPHFKFEPFGSMLKFTTAIVTETTETPKLKRGLTRRQLIAGGSAVALGAVLKADWDLFSYLGQETRKWALETPKKPSQQVLIDNNLIYPGWIERRIESPLLQSNYGYLRWLTEAVNNNPELLNLTRIYYQALESRWQNSQRFELGEALFSAMYAGQLFMNQPGVDRLIVASTRFNREIEATHLGVLLFGAGFTPWFNLDQLKKMGMSKERVDKYPTGVQFYWAEDGFARKTYPQIFSAPLLKDLDFPPKYSGQDRTGHFAGCMLLTFEYLYSNYFNLSEHKYTPNPLRLMLDTARFFGHYPYLKDEALQFTLLSGLIHEILGLRISGNRRFWDRENVYEGILDSMVEADLKANELGAKVGIDLFYRALNGHSIEALTSELNKTRFKRYIADHDLEITKELPLKSQVN